MGPGKYNRHNRETERPSIGKLYLCVFLGRIFMHYKNRPAPVLQSGHKSGRCPGA